MRPRIVTAALCAVAGAAGATAACGVVFPTVLETSVAVDASSGDGGTEAATDGANDAVATCVHARWPDPPDAADVPEGDAGEIVLALQTLDLDPQHTIGLDLDDQCTCPGPESCMGRTQEGITCDNANGRDPVLNHLLVQIGAIVPNATPTAIGDLVTSGAGNWVLRIRGYSGFADDPSVVVELFPSPGTVPDDAGVPTRPRFDGNDVWQVTQQALLAGSTPEFYTSAYLDFDAYVTDHVLVARPKNPAGFTAAFGLPVGRDNSPLYFSFVEAVVTGTLVAAKGSFVLQDGKLGARLPSDGKTGGLASLAQANLCPGTVEYETIQQALCTARDVTVDATRDNTGAACGAISVAGAFTATAAQLGPAVSVVPVTATCDSGAFVCP